MLSRPHGTVRGTGAVRAFTDVDAASAALRAGTVDGLTGAIPFDLADPAALEEALDRAVEKAGYAVLHPEADERRDYATILDVSGDAAILDPVVAELPAVARRGSGVSATFTVRKISNGIGVERIFPVHSPMLGEITVVRRGLVRRAKLYYLRNLRGKAARIRERRETPAN